MNGSLLLSLIDGFLKGNDAFGRGAIVAVLCIVMVFVILALIIAIAFAVNLLIQKFAKEPAVSEAVNNEVAEEKAKLDVNDEDAVVATLIASIDLRNETNKNVKVISVKEIK